MRQTRPSRPRWQWPSALPDGDPSARTDHRAVRSDDVLDSTQQAAFEAWAKAGRGYLGEHSAPDTEYPWPFCGQLVGAYSSQHPDIQPATVEIQAPPHPAIIGLPSL